ncbi:MAG TPA: non-homologous end-joining DNA ligase [Actinocrinis sp.]|nr:non-homologous end-joining DNA ligase [Actinocrinis sp.]
MANDHTWAGLRAIAPMLATPGRLPSEAQDELYGYEVKWDGVRAVGYLGKDRFQLISRNDRDITAAYPELAPKRGGPAGRRGLVLDGEIVAFDADGRPSFGALQPRMHVRDEARIARLSERTPVVYIVFDVLRVGARSLIDEVYRERRAILSSLNLAAVPSWQVPEYQAGGGAGLYAATREEGLEGVIAKRLASTYQAGRRSADWIKVKHVRTQEVVVGGWTPGEGRRHGAIGSLLLGIPSDKEAGALEFVGLVGTGFSEQTLADLGKRLDTLAAARSPFAGRVPPAIERAARWVRPKLVGEVVYAERTRDGMLRTPSWRGLRPDKAPGEVRLE